MAVPGPGGEGSRDRFFLIARGVFYVGLVARSEGGGPRCRSRSGGCEGGLCGTGIRDHRGAWYPLIDRRGGRGGGSTGRCHFDILMGRGCSLGLLLGHSFKSRSVGVRVCVLGGG